MAKKLLEVQDLHYYYGNIHAVKGISLYVEEGEMVTIIGSNGAGKTTTMQTIAGLTKRRGVQGKIFFDGTDITNYSGHKVTAAGIAQSLEGRHVFAKLSVEENLMMGAYTRKDKSNIKKDLDNVYERFPRLLERRTQMGGTLSGGEQQMLAIGRALIARPRMIMLDEPSLGLAPLITLEIFEAVKEINKEGTTVLFVEQNARIAMKTAHRAYVMQTGEMVMEGLCADLAQDEEVQKAYLGA